MCLVEIVQLLRSSIRLLVDFCTDGHSIDRDTLSSPGSSFDVLCPITPPELKRYKENSKYPQLGVSSNQALS